MKRSALLWSLLLSLVLALEIWNATRNPHFTVASFLFCALLQIWVEAIIHRLK